MIEHDAPLLPQNLAKPAAADELTECEAKAGFSFPSELRALWALHNGQKAELNGFIGSYDLFSAAQAVEQRASVLNFVDFLRNAREDWPEAGVVESEIQSSHWLPVAGRDLDFLVVQCDTGRVFACGRISPALQLEAESLTQWFENFARAVEAGEYLVEQGFGDYYLERNE